MQAALIWYLASALQKGQSTDLVALPHVADSQSTKIIANPSSTKADSLLTVGPVREVVPSPVDQPAHVAFAYGTTEDAGRFVGVTFRRLLEATKAQEIKDVAKSLKEIELDLLSLGPFIKQAENFEADPARFSQFQAALLGEVLGLGQDRQVELRDLLKQFKIEAAAYPLGSEEWAAVNRQATLRIVSMLSSDDRDILKSRVDFISTYGVLVTPTYSVLSRE